jgi:hypothetical protein
MPYPLKNPSRRLDHALKELAQLLVNNRTRPEGNRSSHGGKNCTDERSQHRHTRTQGKAASDTSSKLTTGKEIEEPDLEASWTWTG